MTTLRAKVLEGVALLILRRGIWMPLSFGAILLLTQWLGPETYGIYLSVFVIADLAREIALFGQDAFLTRRTGLARERFDTAASLLWASGTTMAFLAIVAVELLILWTSNDALRLPGYVMALSLPIGNLGAVPLAWVESQLRYREIAGVEILAIVGHYTVALLAAWLGAGVWSFVIGYWCERLLFAVGALHWSGYRPRWRWCLPELREQAGFGWRYVSANGATFLRGLLNPIVIGHYFGTAAVGNVGLAYKLVEALGFIKYIAMRISLPALARLVNEPARMREIIAEGVLLHVTCLTLPLVVASLAIAHGGQTLLVSALGDSWGTLPEAFPWLAAAAIVGGVFTVPAAALHVLHASLRVTAFEISYFLAVILLSLLLVPTFGLNGYGLAIILAFCTGLITFYSLARKLDRAPSLTGLFLAAALAPLALWSCLGPLSLIASLPLLLWPHRLNELLATARRLLLWRRSSSETS